MALQNINGIYYPHPPIAYDLGQSASGGYDATLLDGSTDRLGFLVRVPKTGTLQAVGFLTGTVTTGDTLKISFQDVDTTTGYPDGVVDQYRTVTVADTDDDTWITTGIISSDGTDTGTKRSVTRGDRLFIVIEFDAYVAGNLNLKGIGNTTRTNFFDESYRVNDLAGTGWVKDPDTFPCFALQYDDGNYYRVGPILPVSNLSYYTINTGTTPDEVALAFQVPFACRVDGLWAFVELDGDADLVLYDSDGSTSLASVSLDSNIRTTVTMCPLYVPLLTEVTLSINTEYYVSIKPTTATSINVKYGDVASTAIMAAMPGGANLVCAERTDAGAWTKINTRRPFLGVSISALDDGVGGGGGGSSVIMGD